MRPWNWKVVFFLCVFFLSLNTGFLSFTKYYILKENDYKILSLVGVIPIKERQHCQLLAYSVIIIFCFWVSRKMDEIKRAEEDWKLESEKEASESPKADQKVNLHLEEGAKSDPENETLGDAKSLQQIQEEEESKTVQRLASQKSLLKIFYRFVSFWKKSEKLNCPEDHFNLMAHIMKHERKRRNELAAKPMTFVNKLARVRTEILKNAPNPEANPSKLKNNKFYSFIVEESKERALATDFEKGPRKNIFIINVNSYNTKFTSDSQTPSYDLLTQNTFKSKLVSDFHSRQENPSQCPSKVNPKSTSPNPLHIWRELQKFESFDIQLNSIDELVRDFVDSNQSLLKWCSQINSMNRKKRHVRKCGFIEGDMAARFKKFREKKGRRFVCKGCMKSLVAKYKVDVPSLATLLQKEGQLKRSLREEHWAFAQIILHRVVRLVRSYLFEVVTTLMIFSALIFSNLSSLLLFFIGLCLETFKFFFLSKSGPQVPRKVYRALRFVLKFVLGCLLALVLFKFAFHILVRITPDALNRMSLPRRLCSHRKPPTTSQSKGLSAVGMKTITDLNESLVDIFKDLKKMSDDLDIVTQDKANSQESPEEKAQRLRQIREQEEQVCVAEYLTWLSLYDQGDQKYLSKFKHLTEPSEQQEEVDSVDQYDNIVSRFFTFIARFIGRYIHLDDSSSSSLLAQIVSKKSRAPVTPKKGLFDNTDLYQVNSIRKRAESAKMRHYNLEILWECLILFLVGSLIYSKLDSRKEPPAPESPGSQSKSPSQKISPDSQKLLETLKYYLYSYFSHFYFILMIVIGMWDSITPNSSNLISIFYVFIGLVFLVYNELNNHSRKYSILSKHYWTL